jgi:hypothetical protein
LCARRRSDGVYMDKGKEMGGKALRNMGVRFMAQVRNQIWWLTM